MTIHESERQTIDLSAIQLPGRILDIGGGGEGIIARLAGDRVVAIDSSRQELEDAPPVGLKIVMDARDMQFLNGSFDTVTCFFSLMYMEPETIGLVMREAHRVLKNGGELWIWDASIQSEALADVFVIQLKIHLPAGATVETGYGVKWRNEHTPQSIRSICEQEGFCPIEESTSTDTFFQLYRKV